jgi:ketosteroid isomerase-like protein
MPARTPEESSLLFTKAINGGDLDAVIALYEPDALSLPPTGDPPVNNEAGRREMFAGMLALKPSVDLKVIRSLEAGEIALVTGSWTLSGTAPDGNALDMSGYYADVLRRQADGTWRFVLDNPLSIS